MLKNYETKRFNKQFTKIYNEHGDIPVKHYSGNVCSYNDIESNDVKCVVHKSDLGKSWNFVSGEKFVCIGEEVTENEFKYVDMKKDVEYCLTEIPKDLTKELIDLSKIYTDEAYDKRILG